MQEKVYELLLLTETRRNGQNWTQNTIVTIYLLCLNPIQARGTPQRFLFITLRAFELIL